MKDLRTTTRKSLFKTIASSLFVATAVLFSACGNDDEVNNSNAISDGKMDAAKGMVFKVNFADYNSTDTLQTRSTAKNDTLAKEVVELSNGLLAEVTIKKDTENLKHEATTTRALANDTYTMLAYRGGILRGELKGTVSGGVFTPAAGGPADMQLPVGYAYDFVLFNSAVSQNGNLLSVSKANAVNAFIGRTTYNVTATPSLQEVSFNMQRVVARMKIKLTAYMDITATTAATLSSINTTDVPDTRIYDASTDVWTTGAGASTSESLTFPASLEQKYVSATYTSQSNEYAYFLPSTNPSKLKLKFTAGTMYNFNLANAELNLSVPTLIAMRSNGSYIINVKLMYNFLYLMSDGTTGLIKETTYGGGSKTAIGIVLSRSKRLAIALKDANASALRWCTTALVGNKMNYNVRSNATELDASFNTDMEGYKYTWEASGSSDRRVKANEQSIYPAFYYAGNYGTELTNRGVSVSGTMVGKRWHLPSTGEWKYAFSALTLSDLSSVSSYFKSRDCFASLGALAFSQVGGSSLFTGQGYWTSSDMPFDAAYVYFGRWYVGGYIHKKTDDIAMKVRPFIYY